MKKKKVIAFFWVLLMVFSLGACSSGSSQKTTATKVAPLKTENQLPKNGIVTKEQLATIAGKDKLISFNGKTTEGIKFKWTYKGKQIQNPVDQHLNIQLSEKELESVKKQANNASNALAITIPKMELVGTPELSIYLPKKWEADQVVVVKAVDKKLQSIANSNPKIKKQEQKTQLTFRVMEGTGKATYLVGGPNNQQQTAIQNKGKKNNQQNTTGKNNSVGENNQEQSSVTANTPEKNSAHTVENDSNGETDQDTNVDENSKNGEKNNNGNQKNGEETTNKQVTVSISAATILDNWSDLKKEKQPFVPGDGWILKPVTVDLKSGDSVYDILVRITKSRGIQMEASWTPMYDAYYIEGINQLYEFDCGNLSGWMYRVNGWYPNYGASKYKDLKAGDVIEWKYTCDLGRDIGGSMGY